MSPKKRVEDIYWTPVFPHTIGPDFFFRLLWIKKNQKCLFLFSKTNICFIRKIQIRLQVSKKKKKLFPFCREMERETSEHISLTANRLQRIFMTTIRTLVYSCAVFLWHFEITINTKLNNMYPRKSIFTPVLFRAHMQVLDQISYETLA